MRAPDHQFQFLGQATHVREEGGHDVRWSCGGDYVFRFVRTDQGWKIAAGRFNMARE